MGVSDDLLDRAQQLELAGGAGQRAKLWSVELFAAAADKDFVESKAQELAGAVLRTLSYEDTPSQRAVRRTVHAALQHQQPSFMRALSAGLLKHEKQQLTRQDAYVLLGWVAAVLAVLEGDALAKAAPRLVEFEALLLAVLGVGAPASSRQWKAARSAAAGPLRAQPPLVDVYISVAKAKGSHGLAAVASSFCVAAGGELMHTHRTALLDLYCTLVLSSKEVLTDDTHSTYQTLLATVSHDEFSGVLLPAMLRSVKQRAEPGTSAAQHLLAGLTVDLSQDAAPDVFPLLLQQARHAKEPVRAAAVDATRALGRRVSDSGALASLIGAAGKLLDGTSEGKLKVVAERCGVAACLAALGSSPGAQGKGLADAACAACEFVVRYYKEEGTDEVKAVLVSCLGTWLGRCLELPPSVGPHLAAALSPKEKEPLRRAHLRAINTALAAGRGGTTGQRHHHHQQQQADGNGTTGGGCCVGLGALIAPALAKLVSDGVSKATQRADGVQALLAAATLAGKDPQADAALAEHKVWSTALKKDSPLMSPTTVAKLAPEDACALCMLCEALLLGCSAHLEKAGAGADACVVRALVLLLLHHDQGVRAVATAASACVLDSSPSLAGQLLSAVHHLLQHPGEAAGVMVDQSSSDGQSSAPGPATMAGRFAKALAAVVPKDPQELPAQVVSDALLAAFHPLVTAAGQRIVVQPAWPPMRAKMGEAVPKAIAAHPGEVCDTLLGERGAGSVDPQAQRAGCGALGGAMAERLELIDGTEVLPGSLYKELLPRLQALADPTEHDALTAEEIKIYFTPEGMLSREVGMSAGFVPDIDDSTTLYAAVGKAAETLKPAARPSANGGAAATRKSVGGVAKGGPAAKANGPKPKDAKEAKRLEQLAREAQVRYEVQQLRDRLEGGLHALAGAAAGNANFTCHELDALSSLAVPLLGSPLVGDAAFDAARSLASCLDQPLAGQATTLAAGLRVVKQAERRGSGVTAQELPTHPTVISCIGALAAATKGHQFLAGPVYSFLFPLLRALLSGGSHSEAHEQALGVIALHTDTRLLDVPRTDSLCLLYRVLGARPAYRERLAPLLANLCAGLTDQELKGALPGLTDPQPHVRGATLAALRRVPSLARGRCPPDADVTAGLWLACHDMDPANAQAAEALWASGGCVLRQAYLPHLTAYLGHADSDVRMAVAAAVAAALRQFPDAVPGLLSELVDTYSPHEGGAPHAGVHRRSGTALALQACAPCLTVGDVKRALDFLLAHGLADPDDIVRSQMVAAGSAIIDVHGSSQSAMMLPLFEGYLENKGSFDEATYDLVREGGVVFLGTLARHLDPSDPKVKAICGTLVEVLTTPSEAVQRAVSDCLGPLARMLSGDRQYVQAKLVDVLLDRALKGAKYGDRRGAAFGLAGVVRGLNITSLKAYGVLDRLKAAVENKKDATAREGSLMAFEALSEKLGRLFEPWVIIILPMLLVCFGDASAAVRDATQGAARAIMGQLSAQGVKLVLPALLKGLEDRMWRTKQGSIQLLGAMSSCAPRQLSTCLPAIVPRLAEVLTDPHPKVQAAAKEALNEVGSIIRNPEVANLVPVLLSAIADPNKYSKAALDTLLSTTFVHTIDAASLALIVPVAYRGLRDRAGDVKKRAAMIVGNMGGLVNEPKDLAPYVSLMVPEIKSALVDPLPEVRAVAAKALGSLYKGMGESYFQELLPWLLDTMRSESSSVERSGAAQGLAEVLRQAGPGFVDALLPDIMASCKGRNAYVREGSLTLFKFLPLTIPDLFMPHLCDVLPAILDGLADEAEGVRDAALAAGRTLVDLYANSCLPLLLPAVEDGITHNNWRIRQSSVELLGDLLYKVAGATGRLQVDMTHDEDEGISTEAQGAAIVRALGMERRNEILARVYMARSDVGFTVRTSALHVWKSIVTNTPRTLGEILPPLMQLLIQSLAADGEDRRTTAGRCLGELVRKMGDRVLQQIIPILTQGLFDDNADTRQGVCYGLKEVLDGVSRHQLADHLGELLPAVQGALTDQEPAVRQAAAAAFGVLFKGGAGSAVESIVPSLLLSLESGQEKQAQQALEGLRVILGVKPGTINAMVPKLLKPPLTTGHVRALGALAEASGSAIHAHVHALLPPLLAAASKPEGSSPLQAAAASALTQIALGVQEGGAHLLVAELTVSQEDPDRRRAAVALAGTWAAARKQELEEHAPALLGALVPLLAEDDKELLPEVMATLATVASTIPKDSQPGFVRCLKDAVSSARDTQRRKRLPGSLLLPGLALPKSLAPLLPIYLQGLLQGSSADIREMAAEGLGELLSATPPESLRPFTVQVTGPLIRIMGDRFPPAIKAAILHTQGVVIDKAGPGLKPFVPQLQTTFLKCLSDPARPVRQKAAANLGALSALSARLDPLANELATGARTAEPAVQEAYLFALRGLLGVSGARLSTEALAGVGRTLVGLAPLAGEDELLAEEVAQCLGVYCGRCPPSELRSVLGSGPLAPAQPAAWSDRLVGCLLLAALFRHSAGALEEAGVTQACLGAIEQYARDTQEAVKIAAARAAGHAVIAQAAGEGGAGGGAVTAVTPVMVALLGPDQSPEVQRVAMLVLRKVCAVDASCLAPAYGSVVPCLVSLSQATVGPIKAAAEQTLTKVLQLDKTTEPTQELLASSNAGAMVKRVMTDTYMRKLSKLTPVVDDEDI